MWPFSKAREFVGQQFFVRLRYYDNKNKYDSLRIIQALDADDAISQVTVYAKAEDMYWFDVSLPTPKEMADMKAHFDREWDDYRKRKATGLLPPASGSTGLQPC